jgi:glycine cleavage system T protein
MKRTPFYHQFLAAGATMAPAQGWLMPDEVSGNRTEHLAVRSAAGLFDWSSTGEIEVAGPHALALVQKVIVNDAAGLPVGRVLYTTMCRPDGAIFSDITVYRLAEQRFWLMTAWGSNAAGARPEFDWLNEHAAGMQVCVTDVSPGVALLAVQGPAAAAIVGQLTPADLTCLRTMDFVEAPLGVVDATTAPRAIISRTGYTGELGYELCFPPEYAADIWDALLAAGRPHGLQPAGLKTAFSLRMEKGYIIRGRAGLDGQARRSWTPRPRRRLHRPGGAGAAEDRGRPAQAGLGGNGRRDAAAERRGGLARGRSHRQGHEQRLRSHGGRAVGVGAAAGRAGAGWPAGRGGGRRHAPPGPDRPPAVL